MRHEISNIKSWFFEKINRIEKPLVNLTEGHRDIIQMNKIGNETGDKTTKTEDIQKIIRTNYNRLYFTKLENLDEIDNFIDRYHIPS